jgi:hypothetical protein
MKVKELIEKLQQVDPELDVRVMSAEARDDDPAEVVAVGHGVVMILDHGWYWWQDHAEII